MRRKLAPFPVVQKCLLPLVVVAGCLLLSGSAPGQTLQGADLAVTKTVANDWTKEGTTVRYTVRVTNNGPEAATNVEITDVLQAGVTFVSDSTTAGTYNHSRGVWALAGLASGASEALFVEVIVVSGTSGTTIVNTASVTASDQPDDAPENDSDSAWLTVLPTSTVEEEAFSREVVLTWPEVLPTEGRRLSNLNTTTVGDSASSVTITGEYAGRCDYRLRITKIPRDPGFGLHVQLVYEITDNLSGVGLAVRTDTLDVYQPDVPYRFTSLPGTLAIQFSPTANQPTDALGTIRATIGGLSTSSSPTQNYFATALNAGTLPGSTLQVQVVGPVPVPVPSPLPPGTRQTTLSVTQPGFVHSIQNGQTISFSEGQAAPGDTTFWTARYLFAPSAIIRADLEAFEGYHVWRSDLPDVDSFTLLGEIQQCPDYFLTQLDLNEFLATDVSFFYSPTARTFTLIDHDVHNDFPYRYAVSTFDRGFLGNPEDLTFEGTLVKTQKLYPAVPTRRSQSQAIVVPNPYVKRSAFQERGRRVVFANLPNTCTIRIFTVSAEHVVTLRHGPGEGGSTSPTSREWDLRSDAGVEVAAGIYLYYIEGAEFQQRGKLMVAR